MPSFSIPMLGYQRPIIKLYGTDTLIDTGAMIPMTTFSPEILKLAWDAKLVLTDTKIGGIGGISKGDVYSLKNFNIGDFNFEKIEMFVPKTSDFKYSFLLSSTLFYNTEFTFDLKNKDNQSFTVNYPKSMSKRKTFEIKSLNGELLPQIDGILIQDDIYSHHIDNYTQTPNPKFTDKVKMWIDIMDSEDNKNEDYQYE